MDSKFTENTVSNWRIIVGCALLILFYIFRLPLVRFTLQILRRIFPLWTVYIRELERNLLRPLSWLVFILIVWLFLYLINVSALLHIPPETVWSVLTMVTSVPLLWTVICLCSYITWVIIRIQGWNRSAALNNDDYSRVMIITETISVVRFILIAVVISTCVLDELGDITPFNTAEISTVAVIILEIIIVLGGHTWFSNVTGNFVILMDNIIERQSHVRILHHEGFVERMHLQCFTLRKYDQSLIYFPNGILMENSIEIQKEAYAHQCRIHVPLCTDTKTADIRKLIQSIDEFLQLRNCGKNSNLLQIRKRRPILGTYHSTKLTETMHEQQMDHSRYYVAVNGPFSIEIVFYTAQRDQKSIVAEMTEISLHVVQKLEELELRCDDTCL